MIDYSKFPDYIDNSIRETLSVCMTKGKYSHIMEIAPEAKSVHLHAGGAFAKGLEVTRSQFYEKGIGAVESINRGAEALILEYGDFQPPENSYKTADNMAEALRYYFKVWPLGADGIDPIILPRDPKRRGIELAFSVPIPGVVHPDHGGPIYYVGRPDMVAGLNGLVAIEDDKTASSLGDSWSKNWDLDSQFTGYKWALKEQYGIESDNVLVRGVSILKPKFKESPISAEEAAQYEDQSLIISKVDKRGSTRFYRTTYDHEASFGHAQALVYRPQWMVDRWLKQLQRDVKRFIHAYINDEWDLALHKGACNAYGGCPYKILCESEHPEQWIPVNFVHRHWDPRQQD